MSLNTLIANLRAAQADISDTLSLETVMAEAKFDRAVARRTAKEEAALKAIANYRASTPTELHAKIAIMFEILRGWGAFEGLPVAGSFERSILKDIARTTPNLCVIAKAA